VRLDEERRTEGWSEATASAMFNISPLLRLQPLCSSLLTSSPAHRRALISRALEAAAEDENASVGMIRKNQRPLWDMLLKFECEIALTQQDFDRVRDVELRR